MTYLTRQRCKLLALISVFAAPLIVAWIMVQWRIGIPDSRTAHGQLEPDLPSLQQWPLADWTMDERDWVLAFDCSRQCEQRADRWWRLHRALGREAPRVSRLRIGGTSGEPLPGEYQAHWLERPDWTANGRIWVFDPHGEVVLSYSPHVETEDVLNDIQLLLDTNPEEPGSVEQ